MAFSGICPCGEQLNESHHEVKTEIGARRWVENYSGELPLSVRQKNCVACGRLGYVVTNKTGAELKRMGL